MSFGLPPCTDPPPAPQPRAGGEWFVHVVNQVRNDDGTVSVTFSGPALTMFTVRVPLTSWLHGEHLRLASLPGPFLATLVPDVTRKPGDGNDDD